MTNQPPAGAQFPDEQNASGEFERQEDAFRDFVSTDGSTPFPAEAGRYHLYVSLACPWAHRTLIVRHLKQLETVIGFTVADPVRDDRGWAFRDGHDHNEDPIEHFKFLREAYLATDKNFKGRVTVPVLWDKVSRRIVNNSEDDICVMLNNAFSDFVAAPSSAENATPPRPVSPANGDVTALGFGSAACVPDLFPAALATEQKELSERIYEDVNNGVYRAGFATEQRAYEHAVRALFVTLDALEERLADRRYLFGAQPVETDWRLFCTLVRFDSVYHGHFKCNIRRIVDYKNLQGYLQDLYQLPGIASTVNFDHIKRHYYMTHEDINPTRIVPIGPDLDLSKSHDRDKIVTV